METSDILPRHAKPPRGCATTVESQDTSLLTVLSHEPPMASSATPVVVLDTSRLIALLPNPWEDLVDSVELQDKSATRVVDSATLLEHATEVVSEEVSVVDPEVEWLLDE